MRRATHDDLRIMGHAPRGRLSSSRRAFTLIELVLAALVTALVATAGTALLYATTQAATQTRDLRKERAAGRYALHRINRVIRTARVIGRVKPDSVTLWVEDVNDDDAVSLYEVGIIAYDSTGQQITYHYMEPPATAMVPDVGVSYSTLKDDSILEPLMTGTQSRVVVWADNVDSFSFTGHPNLTETRIVETQFSITTDGDPLVFHESASPRASADYLFDTGVQYPADAFSNRVRRRHASEWDGFGTFLSGQIPIGL
ncbi:MAG: PilW family protein [Phycisphaerae bacterium]